MTDVPDRKPHAHRSHKAPESVRNLLEYFGFKGPEDPLGETELPDDSPEQVPEKWLDGSDDE